MPTRTIAYYLDGRLIEWAMSAALVLVGFAILIWPEVSHGSILQILVVSISGVGTGILFITVGVFSIVALVANGRSLHYGPRIRAVSAVIRSVIWMTFTLSMVRVSVNQGFPSPMVFFFGVFTLTELFIAWRAVLDVRTNR